MAVTSGVKAETSSVVLNLFLRAKEQAKRKVHSQDSRAPKLPRMDWLLTHLALQSAVSSKATENNSMGRRLILMEM